jgi:hypothetical protein
MALIHDIIIMIGLYSIIGLEADSRFLLLYHSSGIFRNGSIVYLTESVKTGYF